MRTTTEQASEKFAGLIRRLSGREDTSARSARSVMSNSRDAAHGAPGGRAPFVTRMRVEIRRAVRSGRALSLVLLRLPGEGREAEWAQLWNAIERRKRETDIASQVGPHVAAVLLLDTDEAGAQVFAREIGSRVRAHQLTVIAQAYPGHLFHNLVSGDDPVL